MHSIFAHIEKSRRTIAGLTARLIEIPTQNPPGENYERIVSFLEAKCKKIGLATRRIVVPESELKKAGVEDKGRRIILLASYGEGKAEKTLHLNGHYDVVPATGNWKRDPFKAAIAGGRIYGRGAEDDKGNIACILYAAAALIEAKVEPKVNIELSFTPDEETGGETGFGYLVREGLITADYAIGEGNTDNYLSFGNKGILWAEVEIRGVAAHASEPYRGVNAFEKMLVVASEFMKLKKKISKRRTGYETSDARARYATFVIGGKTKGGSKINTVPDKISFTIDRRVLPDEDFSNAKREIMEVLERLKRKDKYLKARLTFKTAERAVVSDIRSRLGRELSAAIKAVYRRRAHFAITSGGTDMRYLINKGIPCAGYSARGGERCHSDNEFVYIDSLVKTTKVLAYVMANLT